MRPLQPSEIKDLLTRFENFKAGEFRFVRISSATTIEIQISVQDSSRGFDWIDLSFELSDVTKAQILDENRLDFLDMEEGINIFYQDKSFIFCHGNYNTLKSATDSLLYAVCGSIKYKELPFSQ